MDYKKKSQEPTEVELEMKLFLPPLNVSPTDGFKNDLFGRSSFGQALHNLIVSSEDELVISLDGKWGEGKTTFVKMWQGLLHDDGISSIYFDAFANDFLDDPFIALASAISSYMDAHVEPSKKEKIGEFKKKAVTVGKQLLSWSAKLGVKAATLGIVKNSDIDELLEIKDEIAGGVSGVIGDFIEEKLLAYSKNIELFTSFKETLSKLPGLLSEEQKPLVVIIDELDRCRPNYSVEMLEKVKHFFSTKGVVFVLVMHKKQLEESIKGVYGNDIDANTYLQKFITIETNIPKQINERHINDVRKYCQELYKKHGLNGRDNYGTLVESVELLARGFDLSLRQLEKVFVNITIFYTLISERHLNIPVLVAFLAIAKVIDPELFNRLVLKQATYKEAKDFIEKAYTSTEEKNKSPNNMDNWVQFCLADGSDIDEQVKNMCSHSLVQYSINRNEIIPYFAKAMGTITLV